MVLKNQMKSITVQVSKNVFGAVVSPIKLEITTVPNSKIVYRAVFSKNLSLQIPSYGDEICIQTIEMKKLDIGKKN